MALTPVHFAPFLAAPVAGAIGWSLVLIALLVVAFIGLVRLRRWIKEEEDDGGAVGFGISDLRKLHREGKLTDEEFEKARGQMIAGAKAMTENLPDPLARKRSPGDRPRPPQPPGAQG